MRTRPSGMQRQRYAGCSASDFTVCSATVLAILDLYPLRRAEGLSYTLSFVNPPRNPVGKRNKSLANAIWPEVDALRPTKTRRLL